MIAGDRGSRCAAEAAATRRRAQPGSPAPHAGSDWRCHRRSSGPTGDSFVTGIRRGRLRPRHVAGTLRPRARDVNGGVPDPDAAREGFLCGPTLQLQMALSGGSHVQFTKADGRTRRCRPRRHVRVCTETIFGTFSWQMQPYCNSVTSVAISTPTGFTVEGLDDQCGGPNKGSAVGTAAFNAGGNLVLTFTLVAVIPPGACDGLREPGQRRGHLERRLRQHRHVQVLRGDARPAAAADPHGDCRIRTDTHRRGWRRRYSPFPGEPWNWRRCRSPSRCRRQPPPPPSRTCPEPDGDVPGHRPGGGGPTVRLRLQHVQYQERLRASRDWRQWPQSSSRRHD